MPRKQRISLKERRRLADLTIVDLKHNLHDLSLKLTGIIKNSNSPSEASGNIANEVKNLLEKRINLLISVAKDLSKDEIIKQLVELKSEVR